MNDKYLTRKCPICGGTEVKPDLSFTEDLECAECGSPVDDDWSLTVVPHIMVVSRYDPRYFADRSVKIVALNDNFDMKKISFVQVPLNLILCDGCNAEIKEKTVGLLMLDGHVCRAVCEGCRAKHYSRLPMKEDLHEGGSDLDSHSYEGDKVIKEENVSSKLVTSTCPCYQNLEDVITDEFVVFDEETGGYIRYLSIDEKCKLCGKIVNSYGDLDDATEEDYRLYRKKRLREGAVLCPYCRGLFDSEAWLARHIISLHTGTIQKEGDR